MRVFVKWVRGGDAGTVDLDGGDSLELIRQKVAAVTNVHPSQQVLVFRGAALRDGDAKSVREYGIDIDDDLRLSVLPGPRVVKLDVGGEKITTTLETLLKIEGSRLALMFDGLSHQAQGKSVPPEGDPQEMSTVLLPRDADGAYVIDRDPCAFRLVLNYLREAAPIRLGQRSGLHAGTQTLELEPQREQPPTDTPSCLPCDQEQLRQLAIEARYFGLEELATACTRGPVFSLQTFAAACAGGFTTVDVVALSDSDLEDLLQQHNINVLLARRIKLEVAAERDRLQAERDRLQAEATRLEVVETLRSELRTAGFAGLSDAGLRALVDGGLTTARMVGRLDAAAVERLGLSVADAQFVEGLVPQLPSYSFAHCEAGIDGRGTDMCSCTQDSGWLCAVGDKVLDTSRGPVYWKVEALAAPRGNFAMVGVIGNAHPANQGKSYNDPTAFGWQSANSGTTWRAGKSAQGFGGWRADCLQHNDKAVLKLEAAQLSVRIQRLGETFSMPTNGAQNLRVWICMHGKGTALQVSPAELHEEY